MPTIDQLAPAPAAADTDVLVASQAGMVRRVTRAQMLAGTQPLLSLASGVLLGRNSAGLGSPEAIGVGTGLQLAGSVLSAVPALPAPLNGRDASAATVIPAGATVPLTLAALLADAVMPESFGAVGDGVTDDTAALAAAVATRRPVLLGPRTYATTGQWTIPIAATLLGAANQTTIRRIGQAQGGAWISIQGPSFTARDVIFDASLASPAAESWAVLVTAACSRTRFEGCTFANAPGATLGNGLTVLASDPAVCSHQVLNCEASGNAAHGIWVQAVDGATVTGTAAHDNGGYGICLDYNDPTFAKAVRLCTVAGNRCWANTRGISIGNFNATNLQPPSWGNANPDAVGVLVRGNTCSGNTSYGIAVSGRFISVDGNMLSGNGVPGGAGLLANCSYSRVAANLVSGGSHYGIDAGGSTVLDICDNQVTGAAVGINPGGSTHVRVCRNLLPDNGWAITVYNVETDGTGRNFGQATSDLVISDNSIGLADASSGGIWLIDAPQSVLVARNSFHSTGTAAIGQCLYAHTDSVVVEGNRWNNSQRLFANPVAIGGLQTVMVPDIADEVMVSVAPNGVQSIQSTRQIAVAGQIGFIKVTAGGQNYTSASVAVSGSGSGASATAFLSNGAVIGVSLTNAGSGYGGTASVTITGDGTGAAAVASVGLPVLEGRRIRIACNVATRFARAGSVPFQENWTLADMTVPANATIGFTGTFGAWRADAVPLADYLVPPGDGSLTVRSVPDSDLTLRPGGGGHLRIGSDSSPTGYVAATGHGSPDGVVSAPPGSDYRNLDGGAGQTLWIKRTGTDAHGWFALA